MIIDLNFFSWLFFKRLVKFGNSKIWFIFKCISVLDINKIKLFFWLVSNSFFGIYFKVIGLLEFKNFFLFYKKI